MKDYDLIILGGGAAGLAAAQAAQGGGRRIALVEPGLAGGTGFHAGPQPLLHILKQRKMPPAWSELQQAAAGWAGRLARRWKDELLRGGVDWYEGRGALHDSGCVEVQGETGGNILKGRAVLIATGSGDRPSPVIPFDESRILPGDRLARQTNLPESLLLVTEGWGPCLEWACLLRQLDRKVFLCDPSQDPLSGRGPEWTGALEQVLRSLKIKLLLRKPLQSIYKSGEEVRVTLEGGVQFTVQQLIFIGPRRVSTETLNRGGIFPKCGPEGEILVNEQMETTVPGVFAAGSVTGHGRDWMRSQEEGRVAGANAVGKKRAFHPERVPRLLALKPPFGAIGCSAEEAHHFGFRGIRGRGGGDEERRPDPGSGTWCQLVVDRASREIIGGETVGEESESLLWALQTAMRKGLKVRDLCRPLTCPGSGLEVLQEAARDCLRGLEEAQ